jgi:hypothetical protein
MRGLRREQGIQDLFHGAPVFLARPMPGRCIYLGALWQRVNQHIAGDRLRISRS